METGRPLAAPLSPCPRRGLPGPPELRVAAAARGLRWPGVPRSLLPHRSQAGREEGRRGAAESVSGPRGERHRHLFARLSPARARCSERVRLLPAGWAVARALPARLLLPLLLSANPRTGSAGPPPRYPPRQPRAVPERALGSLWHLLRTTRPRRVVRSTPTSVRPSLLFRCYSQQQLQLRDTHCHTATSKPILAVPGDLKPARRAPQQQSDRPRVPTQPDNPRLSTPALAPSLASPQGLSPPVVDTAGWQQKAIAAGQGPSVFRAPLSFYGPLGCVVLPLSDRLREETRLGDPKTTNPCIPRDEGERGMVLGISGAQRLEVGTNKRNGGERLCLLCGGIYTSPTFLSNRHHKPPRHCCIQLRERSTACQRSQSPPVVEMRLNPVLRISLTKLR
ncbi:uncharacterized protein LOC109456740 [Rhinolophus sinicus]|uniref:uncharacterized protein LOC109456740 n=1 Tax=Rhinolophus sinicus TaxID=89399 RepID=UPI003D7AF347